MKISFLTITLLVSIINTVQAHGEAIPQSEKPISLALFLYLIAFIILSICIFFVIIKIKLPDFPLSGRKIAIIVGIVLGVNSIAVIILYVEVGQI